MKRFAIAAVFAAFIVLVIGIYYVQAAGDRSPQFRLTAVEGDPQEARSIVLLGWYRNAPYSENVKVYAEGSQYFDELSLFDRLQGVWSRELTPVDRLIFRYPEFMRANRAADYQDDGLLVRVQTNARFEAGKTRVTHSLKFDLLDKKTRRTRSLRADLPENDGFNGIGILDVQRSGDGLKVAVEYDILRNDGTRGTPEIRVYDIRLDDGSVAGSQIVQYGLQSVEGQEIHLSMARSYDWTLPSDSLVLEAVMTEDRNDGEAESANQFLASAGRSVAVERRLVVYRYDTGDVRSVALPIEPPDGQYFERLYQIGSEALDVKWSAKAAVVQSYDLADAIMKYEKTLAARDLQADSILNIHSVADRLYLLLQSKDAPAVAAIDPSGGQIVFRGMVEADEGAEGADGNALLRNLSLDSVYLRE
jgi:hypothetical protein